MEYRQRRKILQLNNHISNHQIKTKTAHWFSRPLANSIIDTIENQSLLEPEDIELMKKSPCYFSQDKITQTKVAQQKIQKRIDPNTWKLSFAISSGKTTTNWSLTHWCRKHQKFVHMKHMEECDLIFSKNYPSLKPTHYNDFWHKEQQLEASETILAKMNLFYMDIQESIAHAEERGQFIPTKRSTTFPKVNNTFYEPEGSDWIE